MYTRNGGKTTIRAAFLVLTDHGASVTTDTHSMGLMRAACSQRAKADGNTCTKRRKHSYLHTFNFLQMVTDVNVLQKRTILLTYNRRGLLSLLPEMLRTLFSINIWVF